MIVYLYIWAQNHRNLCVFGALGSRIVCIDLPESSKIGGFRNISTRLLRWASSFGIVISSALGLVLKSEFRVVSGKEGVAPERGGGLGPRCFFGEGRRLSAPREASGVEGQRKHQAAPSPSGSKSLRVGTTRAETCPGLRNTHGST